MTEHHPCLLQALVEYEIPHLYRTVARNSPKRKELESKWGSFQVPYLEVRPFAVPTLQADLEGVCRASAAVHQASQACKAQATTPQLLL